MLELVAVHLKGQKRHLLTSVIQKRQLQVTSSIAAGVHSCAFQLSEEEMSSTQGEMRNIIKTLQFVGSCITQGCSQATKEVWHEKKA